MDVRNNRAVCTRITRCWADLEKDQRAVASEEEKQTGFSVLAWMLQGWFHLKPACHGIQDRSRFQACTGGTPGLMEEREGNGENKQMGSHRRMEGGHSGMKESK